MTFIPEKLRGTVGIADDIAVPGPTEEKNMMPICKDLITFFGMLFDAEGVHPDQENVEAIRAIQAPEDAQELHSFFGIAIYMSPFIPNLSFMSKAMRNLRKKGTDFRWSPSHSAAFEKIKLSVCLHESHLRILILKGKQSSSSTPPLENLGTN